MPTGHRCTKDLNKWGYSSHCECDANQVYDEKLGLCEEVKVGFEIPFNASKSMFGAGEIKVLCQIEDREDLCKFDTGANISTIAREGELLAGQEVKVLASSSYTTASGAVKSCDFIEVLGLKLGSYEIEKLTPVSCTLNENETPKNLIGLDAISNQRIYIDYKNQKIIVGYGPSPEQKKKMKSFDVDGVGHILIPVKILNGAETWAMFDTGASLTVVRNQFMDQNNDKFYIIDVTDMGKDSFGNSLQMRKSIASMEVDNEKYVAEYYMGIDFSSIHKNAGNQVNYILGHNIISQSNWYFDFKNKTWFVE